MFRTIIINTGEIAYLKEDWLVVSTDDGEKSVPINDLYSVVIDNPSIKLTVMLLNRLTESGAHVILCGRNHLPATVILPNNSYYRPLSVLKKQITLVDDCKNEIWRCIVRVKLRNQASVMNFCGGNRERIQRVLELSESVTGDDEGNNEAIAAKLFFRDMYGSGFIRQNDDSINAALNYGYAIIRSAVSKSLVAHGFNCTLGIHHRNEFNEFNLADDMMEPLRPLVDYWVYTNREDLYDELSRDNRASLVNLINVPVLIDGKRQKLRNAIESYVVSFVKCVNDEKPSMITIPEIYRKCFLKEEND